MEKLDRQYQETKENQASALSLTATDQSAAGSGTGAGDQVANDNSLLEKRTPHCQAKKAGRDRREVTARRELETASNGGNGSSEYAPVEMQSKQLRQLRQEVVGVCCRR